MESRYKESTIEGYINVFSLHILPYFGKRPISGITPKDIRAWQTELMGKGYSDAYLLRINNMIVSILNFAVSYYDLPSNPCHKAGSMGKRTTVVNFWTIEEYQKILSSVTDKTAHIMFQVFYYSGFRCGEFLALTLEDIDFEKNKISIPKSLRRAGGKDIVTSPKTPKSVRTISMPGFVMDELREYANSIYGLTDKDRIFPFTKSYINGCIRRACKATGIKRIRIHDLRYPNLNKIQTFQRKYENHNKYRLKRFGFYFYPFLLIPQKSTREPSGFFHFAGTFLSFSSSRVASAFAFSSAVMSR